MPRPIWKGHITFGLVNIPVNLYPAEERRDLALHMVDRRNMARIRYERVNVESGEEVPWNEIVRGYEYSDGNYVLLDDKELKRAAPEATKAVEIENFVALDEISPVYFDKPYYLEPAKGGERGYVLLRGALEATGLAGITRVVLRTRQYLAALTPIDGVLVLDLLRYAQELRNPKDLNIPTGETKAQAVSAQEIKIARTLVESMTAKWDPKKYKDEYHDALLDWIERKARAGKGAEVVEAGPEEPEPPPPINFMELLKKSVEQKSGRKPGRKASPARRPAHAAQRRKAG